MEKRYQVFLSSTYEDLQEERLEVLKALLELDCIPCGMEYFPAASEDQWTYIKEIIKGCDYYVVIIGGRYGSTDNTGLSYTEREYDFAVNNDIPAIGFVHRDPSSLPSRRTEQSEAGRAKLKAFISKVKNRLCKEWLGPQELGAVVSRSLTQLIKRHPRTGWVRADALSGDAAAEILQLQKELNMVRTELHRVRLSPPPSAERLAQGSDTFELVYKGKIYGVRKQWNEPRPTAELNGSVKATWDEIFAAIAPEIIPEGRDSAIKSALGKLVRNREFARIEAEHPGSEIGNFLVAEQLARKVMMQLRALGLVELGQRQIEGKLVRVVLLTPLGEQKLLEVSVIRRKVEQ